MAKTYGIESNTVEFKSSLQYTGDSMYNPDKQQYVVFKTVCAYLNTQGGKIYIGVAENDDREGVELSDQFTGIHADMKALMWRDDRTSERYARWVQDRIYKYFKEYEDLPNFVDVVALTENVLLISVRLYMKTVVRMNDGKAYRREGGSSCPMNDAQIHQLETEIKQSKIREDKDFRKHELLKQAIKEEKYVVLKKYSSSHSGTVRDRIVEPIGFQDSDTVITCFEPDNDDHKVGCFKISRMERVELLKRPWEHKAEHSLPELGLFGWSGPSSIDIGAVVPLSVKNILLEQFPSINESNFTEFDDDFLFSGYTRKIEIPARFFSNYTSVIRFVSPELRVEMEKIRMASIGSKELQICEKLKYAMQERLKVKLVNYRSSNALTVRDRLVEPMHLHCNDSLVSCYEADNERHKIGSFLLSRMEDVEILQQTWTDEDKHQIPDVDVFGWTGATKSPITVKLPLSIKNMLMEQYRGIDESCFIFTDDHMYLFVAESNNLEVPAKFLNMYRDSILEPSRNLELVMEGLMPSFDAKEKEIRERLRQAISEHKKVVVKEYRSSHSEDERDRFVEPFEFHNFESLVMCYEEDSSNVKNKVLKVAHMGDVELLDELWEHESEHEHAQLDVFGWRLNDQPVTFSIVIPLSVKNMLMDQFPGICGDNFTRWNDNKYRFTAVSSHLEVPARFFAAHMSMVSDPTDELKAKIEEEKPASPLPDNLPFAKRFAAAWKYLFRS